MENAFSLTVGRRGLLLLDVSFDLELLASVYYRLQHMLSFSLVLYVAGSS